MTEENMEKKIDIGPEDALEYLYEISDKWKKEKDPIESMKEDLRTMIRYFKEEKFDKLQDEFRKEEEINLIPDNVIQKNPKTHSKERPIHSFDLTFEDGINLAWDIVFEIIKREDDKAGNMEGMLHDHISEALQKLQRVIQINE